MLVESVRLPEPEPLEAVIFTATTVAVRTSRGDIDVSCAASDIDVVASDKVDCAAVTISRAAAGTQVDICRATAGGDITGGWIISGNRNGAAIACASSVEAVDGERCAWGYVYLAGCNCDCAAISVGQSLACCRFDSFLGLQTLRPRLQSSFCTLKYRVTTTTLFPNTPSHPLNSNLNKRSLR